MTPEQITDLAILCGCDYNIKIEKIGFENAFKLIKNFGSIEKILENEEVLNSFNITNEKIKNLNYIRSRELFNVENLKLNF
jgi:5'-3' exonuclease